MRSCWLIFALVCLASGCASGGGVPRPFPGAATPPVVPSADADAIVRTALQFRGVPYRNGGSDPSGFDCSGFVQYVFAQHGTPLPREVREQVRMGRGIAREHALPGDLVFFDIDGRGVSHVGLLVADDEFVHAPSSRGVVRVERLSVDYWRARMSGVRRVR